jgi:hypothetical protein
MTTIKATCPTCGEVGLTPQEVQLRVDRTGGPDSFYAFTCPSCRLVVRKPANDRVIRLLVSGGVPVLGTDDPDQPADEATAAGYGAARHSGPPITPDDLLDFHHLLESPGWFEGLQRLVGEAA